MTVNLSALAGAGQQFFDNSGVILSGGKLYSYAAGTTTPQTTYTSASGSTAHSNPIVLDSAGRVPTGEIWLTAGSNYKFALYTSANVLITTWDNITGINGTGITTNASTVEYDPPFTGALTSGYTVQDKLSQYVSVKDFGATGNGTTDDTAAIQAAINSVASSGGTVFLPTGIYKVISTLNIQSSYVSLVGDGRGATIIRSASATNDVIYLQGLSSPGVYNNTLRDFDIRFSVTRTAGNAIRMYRANQIIVERVNIDAAWNCFNLKTTNNVVLTEVVGSNVKGDYGCYWYSLADGTERSDVLTMANTVFNNNSNGGNGIVLDGFVQTLRLVCVGILNANYGIQVKNTAASGSYYPAFIECFDLEIDGTNNTALQLEGGRSFSFCGCDVFNLSTATGPIVNILADSSGSFTSDIRFTGCRIFGGQEQAIYMAGRNFLLANSIVGGGNSTGYNCIDLPAGAQDIVIDGNQIGTSWGGFISKYSYAINIGTTVYRTLVTNNSFYGCLAEVNDASTTSTVFVGQYLNRAGIPNLPNLTTYRSDNNTGIFETKIYNASTGASVTAQRTLATLTANSYVIDALKDNSGSPYRQIAGGPAITYQQQDFPIHYFRNLSGTQQFVIGAALGNYANDGAAAAGGVPLYGYYRNGNAVQQRIA